MKRYDIDELGSGLVERPEGAWYHMDDVDRVTAERDALQQRLTAADEREDAVGSLVPEAELALKALNVAVSVFDVELADSARRGLRLIIAALKPAEGGSDEYRKSCEAAHKALSMENQRITPVGKKSDPRLIDAMREAGYLRND